MYFDNLIALWSKLSVGDFEYGLKTLIKINSA